MLRATLIISIIALAACQHDDGPAPSGLEGYDPNLVELEQAACVKRGGRWGKGGLAGSFVCYEDTGEELKSCSTSNDCSGLCLARSRTCAPVKPFFGCHEILTQSGFPATLCVE